jgi:ArsR family transcriptional regulator, lead/cadmium/zinc/bismuth-responsive transcriptional repressor
MTSSLYLFKALGEETKYQILKTLLDGELCACKIPQKIGRTQSNTSMQLKKLTSLGILKSRREGKKIIYSIKDQRVCDAFKSLGYPGGKLHKSCRCTYKELRGTEE